jgi:hypothetical protein
MGKVSKRINPTPWSARIPQDYRRVLREYTAKTKVPVGLFFTTSGELWCERINSGAQYNYIFRTDDDKGGVK